MLKLKNGPHAYEEVYRVQGNETENNEYQRSCVGLFKNEILRIVLV